MRESSSRVNSVVTCVGAVDVMPRLRFFFLRGMEEMDEVEVTMVLFLDTFSVGLGTSTPVVFLVFFFLFLNMIFFNSPVYSSICMYVTYRVQNVVCGECQVIWMKK